MLSSVLNVGMRAVGLGAAAKRDLPLLGLPHLWYTCKYPVFVYAKHLSIHTTYLYFDIPKKKTRAGVGDVFSLTLLALVAYYVRTSVCM
jgi:hypothetical protein